MSDYVFDPATVAATLRQRIKAGQTHALTLHDDGTVEVGASGLPPLFSLSGQRLVSALGADEPAVLDDATAPPDPLWEASDAICSHMQDDHHDTFAVFLRALGSTEQATGMPWVEARGFVISTEGDYIFVPFPQPCDDAGAVRRTLVAMLKEARATHG